MYQSADHLPAWSRGVNRPVVNQTISPAAVPDHTHWKLHTAGGTVVSVAPHPQRCVTHCCHPKGVAWETMILHCQICMTNVLQTNVPRRLQSTCLILITSGGVSLVYTVV